MSTPVPRPDRLVGAQVTHTTYAEHLGLGRVLRVHPRNAGYVIVRWQNGWAFLEMKHHLRIAGY